MPLNLFLAIHLFSFNAHAADVKQPARIKVLSEEVPDDARHPADLQRKLRHKKATGIEFRDEAGKLKKRIDFADHLRKRKEREERAVEVKAARSSMRVAVTKIARDWDEKNPYTIRHSSMTQIEWYDQDGNRTGQISLGGGGRVGGMSDDGSATAIVDPGFDPEELAHGEVPGLTNTGSLKKDDRLIGHRLSFYRPDGTVIAEQKFKGPSAPPDGVAFSPSGEWVIYSIGSATTFLRNLRTGTVEEFPHQPIAWSVEDNGRLVGWKNEGKGGHWEDYQGRKIWKSDRNVKQRKFVREVGANDVVRTDEVRPRP